MGITSRLKLRYPALAAAANVPLDIQHLAEDLDIAAVWDQGVISGRSAAGTRGRFWYATDTGVLSFDTGTVWIDVTPGAGSITPTQIHGDWTLVPVGTILEWPYAAAQIPAGWGMPYAQAVARAGFPKLNTLAAAAGYIHGAGDGSTTFNLPDRRGRVGVGKDNMGGTAANRVTTAGSGLDGATLGATGGAQNITLTTAQLAAHAHAIAVSAGSDANGNNYVKGTNVASGAPMVQPNENNVGVQQAGGGQAHPNVQPGLIVNYMIRLA